jgi:hypothetical protein
MPMVLIYSTGRKCTTYILYAEALVVASKEIVLEVNADKTKYMVLSQNQHTR